MGSTTVLLLWPLLLSVVWSQSVITDAGPDEFPYVVKSTNRGAAYPITEAAVVVSKKYILASSNLIGNPPSNLKVTNQSGYVWPVARVQSIVEGSFTYLKVCEKFEGATMPMTASSFNNLIADVNATGFLLFYNASSHVLRKLPASAQRTASCASSVGGRFICQYADSTPGYCSFYGDATPTYINLPIIAFGTQVQGTSYSPRCSSTTGAMNGKWTYFNFGYYYKTIIADIPEVDIK